MKVPNVWTKNASPHLLEALRYWGVRSSPVQHAYRPGDNHYASSKFQKDDIVIIEVEVVKTKLGDEAFYIPGYLETLGQSDVYLDIVFVTKDAIVLNDFTLNTPQGEFIVLSRDKDVPFYDWLKNNFDKGVSLIDDEGITEVDFEDDTNWEDVYRDFIHNMVDEHKTKVVEVDYMKDEAKLSCGIDPRYGYSIGVTLRSGCITGIIDTCNEIFQVEGGESQKHNEFEDLYKLQMMIAQKV